MDIRTATQMEKAKKQAVAISAFLIVVLLGLSATFIAFNFRPTGAPPINAPNIPNNGGNVSPALISPVSMSQMTVLKAADFNMLQWNRTAGWLEFDLGYTLGAVAGTAVVAADKGTVKEVVSSGDATTGKLVRIEHANGLVTVYSSLDSTNVTVGQSVKQGDKIGVVGNTAYYEKFAMPHVRFTAFENGKAINPEKYVEFPSVTNK